MQQQVAATADDEGRQSGDLHMTPTTGGAVSENYYTALEGLGEDVGTEDSEGGLSEAHSIKSPLKPYQERQRGMQQQRGGSNRQLSGTKGGTDRKGRRRTESKSRTKAGDTEGTAAGQTRSRGGRSRSTRRRDGDYMARVRPTVEALLGNVEEMLEATVEQQ
jgi:hypothetical protein